jgi:predicted metalloendopeptidase
LFSIRRLDPSAAVLDIQPGSVGLGIAAMYDSKSPRLAAYRTHMAEMFRLAGEAEPQRRADAVIALERALAGLQKTTAELTAEQTQPPTPRPLAALRKEAPAFAWDRYFAALGQPEPAQVLAPEGRLAKLVALVKRTDMAVLRDYLRWQMLRHTATILPPVFAAEHGRMFDPAAAVAGRDAGCVQQAEKWFGPTLGRAYVERHVSTADRTRVRTMVEQMRTVLRGEIERAAWIDATARAKIFAYLDALAIEVAEPPPLVATPPIGSDFLATSLALRKARIAAELAGTATRGLPVTAVNGQMSHGKVSLFAGIVQPPFYTPGVPEPVLLGAIGQIVAHELGHVLDPEGVAQELGLEPIPAYETRVQCVRDSYARAEVAPGLHVDGDFVAKESFADNVGLRVAHALARAEGPAAERQFFVSWAQLMCTHYTPEMLALVSQVDVAPAPLRINQPLRLFPPFAAAFQCAEGTPMHPRDACSPW